MKENNDLDNLFKEGLQQDFPVDENLWQAVESQLPSQESNKGFWIYLNSFAVLAILGMGLMLDSDKVADEKFMLSKSAFQSLLEPKEVKAIPLPALATHETKVKQDWAKQEKKGANADKNLSGATEAEGKRNKKANQSLITKTKEKSPKKIEEKANKEGSFRASIQNKPLQSTQLVTQAMSASLLSNQKEIRSIEALEVGNLEVLQPFGFFWDSRSTEGFVKKAEESKLNKYQQKFKPHFFEYELSYYQSLKVEKQLNELSPGLKNYRDQGEKSIQVEQYGLSIFRPYKFLHFGLGIQYSNYQERATYDITALENGIAVSYDTSYRLVNSNFTSNGVPVILISEEINRIETPTTIANQKQLVVRNEISRLQLPISIAYRRNFGRFQAGLRTSFVVNYLSQSSGAYISDERNRLITFSETAQFNSVLFSHQNQLNLGYALNEYLVFGGRLGHTYDLNSFTKAYDSRLQHYGLGVWFRFKPK